MKKLLRLITRSQVAVEQWSKKHYPVPEIPKWVFSKHIRRRNKFHYDDGTVVVYLDNDWCIHCLPNGRRFLSVLPF